MRMAPTRTPSIGNISGRSAKSSPSSNSVASSGRSGVTKPGRHKNQWSADLKRKAVRLYFFTTLSQDEIVKVLGHGFCKRDHERCIREPFKDEVPSRSTWCKHNAVGHQNAIAQWVTFKQYKVYPWRSLRRDNPTHDQPATKHKASASEDAAPAMTTHPQGHLVLQEHLDKEINKLMQHFGSKYLAAHLSSVASVYCHSLTSTARSSWVSLSSTFRSSETSSIYRQSSMDEGGKRGFNVISLGSSWKRFSVKRLSIFTREEQALWDILIDENQLEGNVDDDAERIEENLAAARRGSLRAAAENRKIKPPATSSRSFLKLELRLCGGKHPWGDAISNIGRADGDGRCKNCGCSKFQETAHLDGVVEQLFTKSDLNQTDFYNNTLLFYYVTSSSFTIEGLKMLVVNGADIMVQNSSGASFMHLFNWDFLLPRQPRGIHNASKAISELIDLLEFLAGRGFPFSHQDEHGQTVAHLLFAHMHLKLADTPSVSQLDHILTVLRIDIDALDNQGHCVGQYLDLRGRIFQTIESENHDYNALIFKMSRASTFKSSNLMLDFKKLCSTVRGSSWPTYVEHLRYSHLIDAQGDSPLIAILKVWDESHPCAERREVVDRLLKLGIGVNLKDRRGNTALAMAARRGFRSTVEQLLGSGANPNTVNYSDRSTLFMTKGWLKISHRMDSDQWYARILSCIPVLQQSQALFEPSAHAQQLSATMRAKQLSAITTAKFSRYLW